MPNLPPGSQGAIMTAYRDVQAAMVTQEAYLLHGLKDIFVAQQLLRGKVVPMERVRYERQMFDTKGSHDAGSFVQQYLYLRVIKKNKQIAKQITSVGSDGVWFLFHPSLIGECDCLIHANNWDAKQHGMEAQYQSLLKGDIKTKDGSSPVDGYIKVLKKNLTDMAQTPNMNNEVLLGGGASLKHLVALSGTKSQLAVVQRQLAAETGATKEFNKTAKTSYSTLMQNISLKEQVNLKKTAPKHFYGGAADDLSAKEKFVLERINAGRVARGSAPVLALADLMFERKDKELTLKSMIDETTRRIEAHSVPAPSTSPTA